MAKCSPTAGSALVTVLAQSELDFAFKSLVDQCIAAAETSLALGADANITVTRSTGTVLRFAAGGKAKTFLDPFVGLHFVGHRSTYRLSKMRIRDFIDTRRITEGVKHNFGRKSAKTDNRWQLKGKTLKSRVAAVSGGVTRPLALDSFAEVFRETVLAGRGSQKDELSLERNARGGGYGSGLEKPLFQAALR